MSALSGVNGAPARTLVTTGYENLFGRSVCGLGDWDNDGFGDFAVGCPNEDRPGALNCGRALIYGGAIRENCTLELFGTMSVSDPNSPYIRVLGSPGTMPVVLADPIPGNVIIPGNGTAGIAFSPWMLPLHDAVGIFGPAFGNPIDSQGLLQIGPYPLPANGIGLTLFVQSFHPLATAANGHFQRSNTLVLTVLP